MGAGNRIPDINNIHNMSATRIHYNLNDLSLGITKLLSRLFIFDTSTININ